MDPQNLAGRCIVLHAFDIGDWVSLAETRKLLAAASTQQAARTRRAPSDFGLDPQPILWEGDTTNLRILEKPAAVKKRAVIYDFGVVSVSLTFDVKGDLGTWRDLSHELYEHPEFLEVARQTAESLADKIRIATDDPRLAKIYESYFAFQIDADAPAELEVWLGENKVILSQVLRGESVLLSPEEMEESLSRRISYEVNDLVVIDWNSALVVDREYDDTLAVLELANAQSLEMRMLDNRLDDMLEEAYRMIRSADSPWKSVLRTYPSSVRRLAELMADAAAEFEAVNNAIKLTNDQYLARVYRIAAKRFHFAAFDEDIQRKLDSLWEIHRVFTEAASGRRLEIMEVIIIVLIAFEIVHSLF